MLNWTIVPTNNRTSRVFCTQWKYIWKLLFSDLKPFFILGDHVQELNSNEIFSCSCEGRCEGLKNWSGTLFNELCLAILILLWKLEMQSDVKNQIIKFIIWTELFVISITLVLREHQISRCLILLNLTDKWIFRIAFCFLSYMKHWQFFKSGKCLKVISWTVWNHNRSFGKRRWEMNAF